MNHSIGDLGTVVSGEMAFAELSPGTQLGRYTVVKLLGRGGMGQVYLVRHEMQRTLHALKILPSEFSCRPGFVEHFKTELQTMASLQHDNIVHVTHSDEEAGLYYLVMDYIVAGDSGAPYDLEEALLEHGPFPPETTRCIMLHICNGLAFAHSRGIIHRDIKPGNILLTLRGLGPGGEDVSVAGPFVKITDFGLAKVVGEEQVYAKVSGSIRGGMSIGNDKTMVEGQGSDSAVLGTYGYMSPEQEEGRPADERSDIYALGVILYRMLTGQKLRGLAKAPSAMVSNLDSRWDEVVSRCLEQEPDKRYQAVTDLVEALGVLGGGSNRKRHGSGSGLKWGTLLAGLVIAGGAIWFFKLSRPVAPPVVITQTTSSDAARSDGRKPESIVSEGKDPEPEQKPIQGNANDIAAVHSSVAEARKIKEDTAEPVKTAVFVDRSQASDPDSSEWISRHIVDGTSSAEEGAVQNYLKSRLSGNAPRIMVNTEAEYGGEVELAGVAFHEFSVKIHLQSETDELLLEERTVRVSEKNLSLAVVQRLKTDPQVGAFIKRLNQ